MKLNELMSTSLMEILTKCDVSDMKIFTNDKTGDVTKIIVEYAPKKEDEKCK